MMKDDKVIVSAYIDRAIMQEIDARRGTLTRSRCLQEYLKESFLPGGTVTEKK